MFKPTKRIEGAHEEGIWAVDWKQDVLCTGSLDGTVKLWDNNLALRATSFPKKMGITSVSLLSNLRTAVSCCQDSTIQFNDMSNFNVAETISPGLLEAWTISVSPDDKLVAGGSQAGAVNIWSVQDKVKVNSFDAGNSFITATAFNPSCDKLACVGIDGILNIFDIQEKKCIFKTSAHALPARCVKFSPDGNLLYTASVDRHVNIFDLTHQAAINSFSHSGMTLSVDISPDNRHFVTGCSNHSVHLWDLGMQRCVQSFETQHTDQVWGVCFSDSGDKFVSVGDDASIQLYENTSVG